MAGSVMRADDVGRAARSDLQFRIPRRPVMRLGLHARLSDEGLVIDGARKTQVLGGAFAREHLADLLEACDASRSIEQIGQDTGIGAQAAFQAVSLLWTGGIVEEGDTPPLQEPGPAPELACLLSRLGDSTGVNDSWQDAARRLGAARVVVLTGPGTTGPAADLADELVAALEPTLAVRAGDPQDDDTLAVLIETAADKAPGIAGMAQRCWQAGLPLLRVRAEDGAVTIGPYVDPAFSPCLECASSGEDEAGPAPSAARRDIVVGLAARAVAELIARATTIHLPGDSRRIDLETLAHTDRPAVTRPGCPVCSISGDDGAPVSPTAPIGARYEQSVAIPPAAFVDSKGHQQHYKPSNLRLQHEFRDWPVCPRTPLPPADLGLLERPWPTPPTPPTPAPPLTEAGPGPALPSLVEVATVLALAVGVREPLEPGADPEDPRNKLRRWTAAGGNVGSVTAYLLVPEPDAPDAPADLAPGTYTYIERDHALALVGPPPLAPRSGLRLVLTGNVDKLARKYFAFGLRLAIQDCGCSFAVIRLVAQALGLPMRAWALWDEQELAAQLGTDPRREPVCAVVDLKGRHAL
ncbi:TOMM precursor leader peptide-binding protein [Actinomyces slackii]|uniref:SagB-type dehydrogenase domain n=1 Tax=Actinomyces slackii TaxID=52774 RepID=A0A3S4WIU8_9ACTO|nr:TOMM precursor leader peptide-binding protein [Actinomyces slackii]VEG73870.1 SagB-type dehydrogenase domain [Actinomyces slackii]